MVHTHDRGYIDHEHYSLGPMVFRSMLDLWCTARSWGGKGSEVPSTMTHNDSFGVLPDNDPTPR